MSKNDITGDNISTKVGNATAKQNFDKGYDAIFKKNLPLNEYPEPQKNVLCDICGKDLMATKECGWTSCPLNFSDSQLEW